MTTLLNLDEQVLQKKSFCCCCLNEKKISPPRRTCMRLNASSAKFRLDPVVSVHLLHPLIRVFSSKSSPRPLSPCSPTHPPVPWGGTGGLLHGWSLAFFVIVMRPSRGQRCQRQQYDSQRRSAHWDPPPLSLPAFSHTLRLSSSSECTQALHAVHHPSFLPPYKTPESTKEFCLLWSFLPWRRQRRQLAARGRESITPLRCSVCVKS